MNSTSILMSEEEPTEAQLNALVQGIGQEAKQIAMPAEKQLHEHIQQHIRDAQERHKEKTA